MKNTVAILLLSLSTLPTIAQTITDSLLIDGHYRTFHYNPPTQAVSGGSLVFVLHGSGGKGIDLMHSTSKLASAVAGEKVILVYANGYKKYWNECRKAASSLANKENIDELSFFSGMINYFKDKYHISDKQVFAVGTSGGGHMCYKLAMTMSGKFRAVAALIANLPTEDNMDCAEANVAISIMIVNGTADPVNPYEGGMMQSANFIMGKVRSTDQSFQYWSGLAGYRGEPVKASLPDADPSDGKTIERYTYRQPGKPEIVLLKVIGGKHDYPNDIDVHVEAWEFFKRQIQ